MEIKITQILPPKGFPWEGLLALAPHLLWVSVAIGLVAVIGPARIRYAFSQAKKLSFGGFELQLKSELEQAAASKNIAMDNFNLGTLERRLDRLRELFVTAHILWIDDNPAGNLSEMRILRSFGATIEIARSDESARTSLQRSIFDLVLSDMSRDGNPRAGALFLPEVKNSLFSPPIIFYVGNRSCSPDGAFGMTTRPDELLHLILDALERKVK
ncbi:hypothetical protein E8L99_21775 [Phreatobacter aquaticus]|uniref:Response regulator n=1 Tax=Phreatobacter aquaticus TaxID=2570229 RepID=A0A4D7QKP8_9HYPH|nr:hypothetical protein [Phreatobacter aquaticus]QCK88198.1 hypothetical protein E8L99_21775 [Phreatobacter aquaticus]